MSLTIAMKKFPFTSATINEVLEKINNICCNDYSYTSGRILNSICSEPLPIAISAYLRAIHTNIGDARLFPGVQVLERMVIQFLSDLLGSSSAVGNIVTGGTEANLLALFVAREIGKNKGIYKPEIIAPYSAHYSIDKVASLLQLTVCYTELDINQRAIPECIKSAITSNTIAIVATAGTSEFGAIDPIEEIASIAKKYGLYFHVDAASGGFIIPFARDLGYKLPQFDFSIPGVHSITIDPHKFGLSVIPAGSILFQSSSLLNRINFSSHYIETKPHTTLSGTRSGGAIAAIYAVIEFLGREGFQKIINKYYLLRAFLIEKLKVHGFLLDCEPDMNIVAIKSKNAKVMCEALEKRGWVVSLSRRYEAIRVVIHNHTTQQSLNDFVLNLAEIERSL